MHWQGCRCHAFRARPGSRRGSWTRYATPRRSRRPMDQAAQQAPAPGATGGTPPGRDAPSGTCWAGLCPGAGSVASPVEIDWRYCCVSARMAASLSSDAWRASEYDAAQLSRKRLISIGHALNHGVPPLAGCVEPGPDVFRFVVATQRLLPRIQEGQHAGSECFSCGLQACPRRRAPDRSRCAATCITGRDSR